VATGQEMAAAAGSSSIHEEVGGGFNPGDRSWQSILDGLTAKANREGLIRSVKNAKTFEDKLRKVMDSIAIRGKLSAWISECAESHYSKSGGTASKLRDEGNFKFRCREYEGSLRLYTESVICAPEFGPELSLAYGNRSACLYHLGHYNDCLQDITLALRYRFPKNLVYKLHQRRGQCQTKLGHFEEAQKSFDEAVASLDFVPKLTPAKKESLARDIHALKKECQTINGGGNPAARDETSQELLTPPTEPTHGLNPSLRGGSDLLELRTSLSKGRHVLVKVVADDDDGGGVVRGDVLFSELPFSSVLLPEHYSTHCHHCYLAYTAPVPCTKCTQPRYCSDACRQESWQIYHQYECTGLDLLHSVGIAHLALRTVLMCGLPRLLAYRKDVQSLSVNRNEDARIVRRPEIDGTGYADVFNLMTHANHLSGEDLFQYAVTAALLVTYLERRTYFFEETEEDVLAGNLKIDGLSISSGGGSRPRVRKTSSCSVDDVDEELVLFVGGVILRHITQLICNASAIYEVGPTPAAEVDAADVDAASAVVTSNSQYRVATAIYPGASMMNHSCDPSVINSFFGARLIVRALKPMSAGDEVFNCYGPHFRHHPVQERQEMLRGQYHFTCTCGACSKKEWTEFSERFSALKCSDCGGPIRNPSSETSLEQRMPCLDCGKKQEYSKQIEQVFLAYDLFKRGMECLRFGNIPDALPALQSCYQLRVKAMYGHHLEVTEVADQLARCYAMMGSFSESAQFLKVCLPAIQERFGMHSVEVGHELVKYTDVLLGDLQDTTRRISHFEDKILESRACLQRAAEIFALHYGKWHNTYQEITQKLDKTKFLVQSDEYAHDDDDDNPTPFTG